MAPNPGIKTKCTKCGGNLAEVTNFEIEKDVIVLIQANCPHCGNFTTKHPIS